MKYVRECRIANPVLGVMSTLGLLALHREEYDEFDEGYGKAIQTLLIETLARGLLAEEPR